MSLPFITESTKSFRETETIGSFVNGRSKNTFESIFEAAHDAMMAKTIDVKQDISTLVRNKAVMEAYKDSVLAQLSEDCEKLTDTFENAGRTALYEQVSQLWDNCTEDFVKESASLGTLLPIKAIDFPVLVKQHLKIASKDIIQTEVTKSPIIKKHVEQRYLVIPDKSPDAKSPKKRFPYPQCFFSKDFLEIYDAGKGIKIPSDPVPLPKLNWNLVQEHAMGDPNRDKLSMNLKIVKAIYEIDGAEYTVPLDMRVNLSDGALIGGVVNYKAKKADSTEFDITDLITGRVDYLTGLVSVTTCSENPVKVVFEGYLSNEYNENYASFEFIREEREWKIEDGFRMNVPYSLEELQDAKALLDIDLYKKTYDNLGDILANMEDNNILQYLDSEFDKHSGVEVDPLGFTSFVRENEFDCEVQNNVVLAHPDYIERTLKFAIDRFVIDLMDTAKMEDVTFVVYGNPRYVSLLTNVNWVVQSGDSMGGIKLSYSYGIMNSGGVRVQIVSTSKVDARQRGLRIIPYPLNSEQMTFKQYKYATHILTTENSGYRAPDRPGGSMTNIMATSRYVTVSVQGIQGKLKFLNTEKFINV